MQAQIFRYYIQYKDCNINIGLSISKSGKLSIINFLFLDFLITYERITVRKNY